MRKKEREVNRKVPKKVRIYKKFDAGVFGNLLVNNAVWNEYYAEENPNTLWENVYSSISNILEVMCPYRNIFVRENRTPWFTREIYECMNKRTYYIRLHRKTGNQDIFKIVKYFRKLVREAKREFIKSNLQANRLNPKNFWRTLNSILKPDKSQFTDVEFLDKKTNRKIPISDTSDFLNKFYANVGIGNYLREESMKIQLLLVINSKLGM